MGHWLLPLVPPRAKASGSLLLPSKLPSPVPNVLDPRTLSCGLCRPAALCPASVCERGSLGGTSELGLLSRNPSRSPGQGRRAWQEGISSFLECVHAGPAGGVAGKGQCLEGLEHSVEDSPCGNKEPLMFSAEKTHG